MMSTCIRRSQGALSIVALEGVSNGGKSRRGVYKRKEEYERRGIETEKEKRKRDVEKKEESEKKEKELR